MADTTIKCGNNVFYLAVIATKCAKIKVAMESLYEMFIAGWVHQVANLATLLQRLFGKMCLPCQQSAQ